MGGKFEQTKPPKPKVPGAPRGGKAAPPPAEGEGNREQRRAAARKKGKAQSPPAGTSAPAAKPAGATRQSAPD